MLSPLDLKASRAFYGGQYTRSSLVSYVQYSFVHHSIVSLVKRSTCFDVLAFIPVNRPSNDFLRTTSILNLEVSLPMSIANQTVANVHKYFSLDCQLYSFFKWVS